MFIIRFKGKATGGDGWVVMKTTLGPLMFGFATEQLAQSYVRAAGEAARIEAISRDDLLVANPKALDGIDRILLFPSLDALRSCYQQGDTFPFADYVVSLSHAA